jgi:aspartyl/glutamyl-tRNA(Asn/Gln) amidotransferase C subunit
MTEQNPDIKRQDIEYLAELSHLEITDAEADSLKEDIGSIVAYISELSEAKVDETAPEAGEVRNVMREDRSPHESGLFTEALLSAAPNRKGQHVAVKKIL